MRIYFSGSRGLTYTPEALVPQLKPHVMLTYYDMDSPGTYDRLNAYLWRKGEDPVPGTKFAKVIKKKDIYSRSIFIDSGAYTLFNDHVEKRREDRMGKHGRKLEREIVLRGQGDYSWFDLSRGSEFREYLKRYAKFIKQHDGLDLLFANVDAIHYPLRTWEIQCVLEDEFGVRPVPIIHGLEDLKWLHKYLDRGHRMIGMGGLGHAVQFDRYIKWADSMFLEICPKSEGYMPQVRVHGFAMTSWKMMCRWPWWSVDSATWVKLAAYGWLYVPPWKEGRWRFDEPPIQINISAGAPGEKDGGIAGVPEANRSPLGRKTNKHVDSARPFLRDLVLRWVKECGLKEGTVDKKGKEVEFGVRSHFRARSTANLHYMKGLEWSHPTWPCPLDPEIVKLHRVVGNKGFGLSVDNKAKV